MSMFGEFLGFDGRISRLGYLWRSLVMGLTLVVLTGLSAWALATLLHPDGVTGSVGGVREVVTAVILLGLWSSFALATRRLRDMGLEPAHVVPFYAALWVCNAALLAPMSRIDPHRFGALEAAWNVIQIVILLPLAFWPPRARTARPPGIYDEPAQPTAYLNWRESG
ncbi:MAG TPA: DUF805 domain-containing protein [Caulobacteraceae bacterium]|nr:DUF805 domain-containing protein [Caulobacteraceae bacterium]